MWAYNKVTVQKEKVNTNRLRGFKENSRIQVIDFCKVKVGVIQLRINKDMQ